MLFETLSKSKSTQLNKLKSLDFIQNNNNNYNEKEKGGKKKNT